MSDESLLFASQVAVFSLYPHIVERSRELFRVSRRVLVLFIRTPSLWPNHLSKSLHPSTTALPFRISEYEFWEDTNIQSVAMSWLLGWTFYPYAQSQFNPHDSPAKQILLGGWPMRDLRLRESHTAWLNPKVFSLFYKAIKMMFYWTILIVGLNGCDAVTYIYKKGDIQCYIMYTQLKTIDKRIER